MLKQKLLIVFFLFAFSISILYAITLKLSHNQSYASVRTVSPSVSVDVFIGEFRFSLFGYASPKAMVTLEGLGIYDQTFADQRGYFEFHNRFSPQSPREACLTSQDQLGRITAPTCLPPFPTKYNTRIGPVLLPPTLSLDKENYWVDDEVKLTGQTTPNSKINLAMFTRENTIFTTLETIVAKVVRPVEAFSFAPLEATADTKGNFSISLPSSRPESFRLFAQTSYDNGQSPESIKLNIKILPIWMIIIQLMYLLWSIIRSRLLEIIIIGELIGITLFFIRRYLHPHIIAHNQSLALREPYSIVKEEMEIVPFVK